jgi:hypothetical protein
LSNWGYNPATVELLAKAARSEDRSTRFGAISALGASTTLGATEALIQLADTRGGTEPGTFTVGAAQAEAVRALGEHLARFLKMKATAETGALLTATQAAILRAAAENRSAAIRLAAIPSLGLFPEGRRKLEDLAKADPSGDVRSAAIEQLRAMTTSGLR